MRILLIKGLSRYGALRTYIDTWNYELQKMQNETYILDASSGIDLAGMKEVMEKIRPEIILTCNAILAEVIEEIMPLNCIYCTVIYDNPSSHTQRLLSIGARSVVLSCDAHNARFIGENYPKLLYTGFLPLSGNYLEGAKAYGERDIDLLFTGSYFNVEKTYTQIKELPQVFHKLADEMIEMMKEEPDTLLWQALDRVLERWNFSVNSEERIDLLSMYRCIDAYMRAYERDRVMRTVVEGGYAVHVYGEGWDRFACKHRENLILEKGYGNVSLQALNRTKISLNVMPWFRAGIQERNISAMLSGAISLTDSNEYLEKNFSHKKDILFYSLKNVEEIPEIIQNVLENPEVAAQIAENGRIQAKRKHTWGHRMEELIKIIGEVNQKK